jgi:hypothetical protein
MRFVVLAAFFLLPVSRSLAFGEDAAPAQAVPSKSENVEIVAPVVEQATQGLFERIRGAYVRAAREGRLAQSTASKTPVKQ